MRTEAPVSRIALALGALAAAVLLSTCGSTRTPVAPSAPSSPASPPPSPSPPPPAPAGFAGCVSTGAYQNTFACMPAGKLLNGTTTWTGTTDQTIWFPNMRFPLKHGPAYLNSQVYRYKGGYDPNWLGPNGAKLGAQNDPGGVEQCDTRNYSFPWQDNFCEQRVGSTQANPSCPGGTGHQGVDIRGPVCKTNDPANEVVAVAAGRIIAIEPHYTKVMSADESVYFNFLHMDFGSRPHTKAQLTATPGGIPVTRGQMLGRIGNIQAGTAAGVITVATTRHLHFEIRTPVLNPSTGALENVMLPPYATLVDAYRRLEAGTP
jgi:hypothetical protein